MNFPSLVDDFGALADVIKFEHGLGDNDIVVMPEHVADELSVHESLRVRFPFSGTAP